MHQKCSNYALTNLFFGLCRFMWVIDLLVTLLNPYPEASTRPSTPKVLWARECVQLFSFHCFHIWICSWIHHGIWRCVIFGARTRHGQTWIYKTHHGPNLGEATTFPLLVFFVPGHGANDQMSFCPKTPKLGITKFSKLGLLQLWKPITSYAYLQLRWCLNKILALVESFPTICGMLPACK